MEAGMGFGYNNDNSHGKENEDMKGKIFAVIAIVLIIGGCLVGGLNHLENYDEFFYAKVDNSKKKALPSNEDMNYEYTLECYNENGKKRELKFKTFEELEEGAYISLEVRISGVHKYEEVEYGDLPKKVQENIK